MKPKLPQPANIKLKVSLVAVITVAVGCFFLPDGTYTNVESRGAWLDLMSYHAACKVFDTHSS